MIAKIKLKPKKEKWAEQFKPKYIKGEPLHNSYAIEKEYQEKLEKLVSKMSLLAQKEIIKLFKKDSPAYFAQDSSITSQARILLSSLNDKLTELFNFEAKNLSEWLVRKVDKFSKQSVSQSLKKLSGGGVIDTSQLSEETKEILKASVNQSADYIKSIGQEYITQIKGAVYRSITTGEGLKDLIPFFEKYDGITKRRAKNIALDQTRKTTSALNMARMKQNGITKFMWNHSSAGLHPRKTHEAFNGNIYSYDEPPYDSDAGLRVLPAQLPNCKCFATPVIEFSE
ncbi:phage head morphogenesis protein [Campylobacter hyointestinalis]|uniref:Phage head morphogenesis protein n=1 Tax=Campylobacter hyointestinalis TaxID=198 RepID=A0A562X725_CAMHY|nr:phage minor head protein [Campylobacter hyointestinalis]TWO17970.1 phage head morphogenesis protein [Campylobacter hyointestinalis]